MNKKKVIAELKEEGFPEHIIDRTLSKVANLQPSLKTSFEQWLKDKVHPSIAIEGYTFDSLVAQYGMTGIGAFLTLDWLIREPNEAKNHLIKGIK
ncbi:MAG: hypothetical protein J5711_02310 [Bacteroidales bacterium]|nr:hypothetical protein [Bacteroidales bacterium]